MKQIRRLLGFDDARFYRTLIKLSLPIIAQQALNALLFLVDNIMVGQLGETTIAGVGLANQLHFLMILFSFGILSGVSIFVSQYWGHGDIANVRRMQGIAMLLVVAMILIFTAIGLFLPSRFLRVLSDDPQVIDVGARYLRIVCIGYVFQAFSLCYGSVLKSCERAILPMVGSLTGVLSNVFLNYCLIFGKLGFPALGVEGAAIATVVAALLDCMIVVGFSYGLKTPAGAKIREMRFDKELFSSYIKVSLPVFLNEVFWSVGITMYTKLYGLLGTQAVAAMQIYNTIDRVVFIFTMALGSAGSVMIGNRIGAGEGELAKTYSNRLVALSFTIGLLICTVLLTCGGFFINFFVVGPAVVLAVQQVLRAFAALSIVQCLSHTLMIGILRPGGDTQYTTKVELGTMWFVSIPLTYIAGLVFGAPLWLCYLAVGAGDALKFGLLFRRYRKGRWIQDVTV